MPGLSTSLPAASERTAIVAMPFTSSLLDGESPVSNWCSSASRTSGLCRCAFTYAMPSALGSCLSARKRSRQPEPWEHAVVEAGHGADPVAGEGEDEQAGSVADAGRGAQVGSERWLAVRSCRHEGERAARAEQAGAEAGHNVSALVFEGHWWHRDEDVVGQEGYHRVEIGGFVGADELRHE